MSVPEAQSRCAALEVLAWDDTVIARELARASAAFLSASPQVSPMTDTPGTWWIGAGGFETMGGEPLLARTLLALAGAWHPHARVGVADSCVAARAATWSGNRDSQPRIVPPGGCAEYLARAPLALIPMDEEFRESLASLGLRTAGALAALDPGEVERRWGAEGLSSWRLANGDDARRPVLARTDASRFVSTELAMSTATMEPVLFIVRAALGQLVDALVHDGRAAAAVAITLTLDDARSAIPAGTVDRDGRRVTRELVHTVTREVRPAKPVARVAPLFERCRAMLDQWTLTAPVSAVTVTVSATAPLGAEQGDLLAAAWRDPAAADAAFERLRATLGAGSVVKPIARDEYRPEKCGGWVDVTDESADGGRRTVDGGWDDGRQTAVGSRLLETPEQVDVEAPRGVPRTLWWRGRRVAITRSRGPERLSGDWWKDSYAREYWRCESDELARDFLLYRDGAGWRLQGWYD